MWSVNTSWRPLLCIAFGWMVADSTLALEWSGSTGIAPSISMLYTDNVCLSNTDQRSEWVGGIGLLTSPTGSVKAKGSRSSLDMGGSVQFNTLTDSDLRDNNCAGGYDNNRQQFAPNLYANGSTTLVDDWLNFSAHARAGQNEISPYVGGGGNSLNTNGNTNTYYLYSLSPVLERRLKNNATYTLQYNYNEILNSASSGSYNNSYNGSSISDSSSSSWATSLASDKSSQISWKWRGNYQKVQYSDPDLLYVNNNNNRYVVPREDTELKSAGLNLGYQIDRRWQVNGSYGWEWNDYQTYNDADTGGQAWQIGVRWTPSPRTTVSTGIGERFFGKTPNLNISHTYKRSVFTASYNKGITFARDIRTQQNLINPGYNYNSSLDTQSPIIEENLTLGYTYNGRRAILNASGSYSDQTQEDNGQKSAYKGLAVTVSPLISSLYTLSGTLAWNENEPQGLFGVPNAGPTDNAQSWITNVQVGRQLSQHLGLSVDYQYTDQQSDDSFSEYQENRVMATLTYSL